MNETAVIPQHVYTSSVIQSVIQDTHLTSSFTRQLGWAGTK